MWSRRTRAHSKTADGIRKPDLVAPGTNIVGLMANPNSVLAMAHPANVVNGIYFRMSGTSMAAPWYRERPRCSCRTSLASHRIRSSTG